MKFPTFYNPFENRRTKKRKKKKPQPPLGSCKVLQISHGVRRGLIPPLWQLEEPRIADAGRSTWLGALGDSGSPSFAEGQPWSGSPFPPSQPWPQGSPGLGPSLPFYATTEASSISVTLWQWRGRAGTSAPRPEGSLELRQSHGVGWLGMCCQVFAIEEKSCCCLDLSEC